MSTSQSEWTRAAQAAQEAAAELDAARIAARQLSPTADGHDYIEHVKDVKAHMARALQHMEVALAAYTRSDVLWEEGK